MNTLQRDISSTAIGSPLRDKCHTSGSDYLSPSNACNYGQGNNRITVFGDSHVVPIAYALSKFENYNIKHLSFSGCPPAFDRSNQNKIKNGWEQISSNYGISISSSAIPAVNAFSINCKDAKYYKTYITQEMLKKGYLATTTIYVSVAHTKKILKNYFDHLDKLFFIISKCENNDDIYRYLHEQTSETDFARLN